MTAIQEESVEGPIEVIQVLFALPPSFGAQELCGPLEVLANARHKISDSCESPLSFIPFLYLLSCPTTGSSGPVC